MLGRWKSYFMKSQYSSAASSATRSVGVQGVPEYPIAEDRVVQLTVNTPDVVFGRIYSVWGNGYREIGLITAYRDKGDAEMHVAHWRAEIYVSQKSYSDAMLAGLGEQLLSHTACREPLMVNVAFGERTGGRYKNFGKVFQDLD